MSLSMVNSGLSMSLNTGSNSCWKVEAAEQEHKQSRGKKDTCRELAGVCGLEQWDSINGGRYAGLIDTSANDLKVRVSQLQTGP